MLPLLSHVECYLLNEGLQNIVADSNVIAFSPHFVMFADARDFFTFLGKKIHKEDGQTLEQVAQRSCGFSILEDIQN